MYNENFNRIAYSLCTRNGHERNEKMYNIMKRFLNLFMTRYEYDGIPEEFKQLDGNRNMFELMLFFSPAVAGSLSMKG